MIATRAVPFLRTIAGLALGIFVIGSFWGRGVLSRSPSSVADMGANLRHGAGDGFMGLVVIAVLVALPMAMLVVAWEGRKSTPRHLWLALATSGTLAVSVLIAVLVG